MSSEISTNILVTAPAVSQAIFVTRETSAIGTINSHRDLYYLIKTAQKDGIEPSAIHIALADWTSHSDWINLSHPEYLYLLYNEMEELVDFRRYFRQTQKPFVSFVEALSLPEVVNNASLLIDLKLFYANIDLALCFDNNNKAVQTQVSVLEKQRKELWFHFLIDPFAETFSDYFNYRIPTGDMWDCEPITHVVKPTIGDCQITEKKQAERRLSDFTHCLFNNKDKPFVWDDVVFAGGSIAKIVDAKYNQLQANASDLDIFVYGKTNEARAATLQRVINWFASPHTFYAVRGSVISVYISEIKRKFQVISSNLLTPYDLVSRFDTSHVQWMYANGDFYGTPAALKSLQCRKSMFINTRHIREDRIFKTLYHGFNLEKTDINIPVDAILDRKTDLHVKLLRNSHKFYYPTDDLSECHRMHIFAMIESDSGTNMIYTNADAALNNVTIGGDFDAAYGIFNYQNFNLGSIVDTRRWEDGKLKLMTHTGSVKIVTDNMCVVDVSRDKGDSLLISVRASEDFNSFVANLYRTMVTKLSAKSVAKIEKHLIFLVDIHILDLSIREGWSIMKTQSGQPLDITEDLFVGDNIQIMFTVQYVKSDSNQMKVIFCAKKIIKKNNPQPSTEIPVTEDLPVKKLTINYV